MASKDDLKQKLAENKAETAIAKKGDTFSDLLERMKPQIQKALPAHISTDRIMRIALTAYNSNPKLRECSTNSILASVMISSQLGLEPNTPLGQCYIIPYFNKGVMEAQFQLGYQGLIELCRRSGLFNMIYAHEVCQGDEFSFCYGLKKDLVHVPALTDRGVVIGYYAVYHLKDGGYDLFFMSKADVEKFAGTYSQAVKKGWTSPWKTDFDAMAKKTVLKQVLKYAPKSIEMTRQMAEDDVIKRDLATDMSEVPGEYVDIEYNIVGEGEAEQAQPDRDEGAE